MRFKTTRLGQGDQVSHDDPYAERGNDDNDLSLTDYQRAVKLGLLPQAERHGRGDSGNSRRRGFGDSGIAA